MCPQLICITGFGRLKARHAVSEDDFALKCFFSLFFEIITCVFILKQLFASGSVNIHR